MSTSRVKYSKHKHKGSPWITTAIVNSIRARDRTYKVLKKTPPSTTKWEALKLSLQIQNKILQKSIRAAKILYYQSHFELIKSSMAKTWDFINKALHRKQVKASSPKQIVDNGIIDNVTTDITLQSLLYKRW
jgi:hypothetical protein